MSYFKGQAAGLVAAGGSALSLLLVLLFVPSSPKEKKAKSDDNKYADNSSNNVLSLSEIMKVVHAPGAMIMLSIKLACGVPIGVLQSMFSGKI